MCAYKCSGQSFLFPAVSPFHFLHLCPFCGVRLCIFEIQLCARKPAERRNRAFPYCSSCCFQHWLKIEIKAKINADFSWNAIYYHLSETSRINKSSGPCMSWWCMVLFDTSLLIACSQICSIITEQMFFDGNPKRKRKILCVFLVNSNDLYASGP